MGGKLTRQALYDLVWSEPVSLIAPRFGVSGVALRKACTKAAVPVPPRGYWVRRQPAKRPARTPLPPRPPGMHDEVTIGSQGGWSGGGKDDLRAPLPPAPSFEEPIEEVRTRVRALFRRPPVVGNLGARSHPAILRVLKEDERRREEARTALVVFDWDKPLFDAPPERRRLRILNGLFLAVERAGGHGWVRARRDSFEAGVTVHQQHIQLRLAPAQPAHGEEPSAAASRRTAPPLSLAILGGAGDQRERAVWQDGPEGRIEDRLAEIVVEVVTNAEIQYREAAVRHHEFLCEVRHRQEVEEARREAEALRREQERRVAEQRERVERLLVQAAGLRQAREIRAYVEAVRRAARRPSTSFDAAEVETWSAWALIQADRIDPIASGAFLSDLAAYVSAEAAAERLDRPPPTLEPGSST